VWAAERSGQVSVRNAKSGLIKSYLDQAGDSNFFIWCMTLTEHDVWMGTEVFFFTCTCLFIYL
jgi:hypothetical protein